MYVALSYVLNKRTPEIALMTAAKHALKTFQSFIYYEYFK